MSAEIAQLVQSLYASIQHLSSMTRQRSGVNRTEYGALQQLAIGGSLTAGQLGERLGITSGAATKLIDRLEAQGYVQRRRSTTDRRSVVVEPRPSAARVIAGDLRQANRDIGTLVDSFTADEQVAIRRFLEEACEIIERHVDEAPSAA
jgi:DNA-binding MarR family transcriptional regulator